MSDITWANEKRKLQDLMPWDRNPRQINQEQAKRLVKSFDEFGQVETIAIGPGNEVYNGHQRLNVLMQQHSGEYEVEVRVSSRALTEKEREKLTIFLHKGTTGEWDFDALANYFDTADLLDWGFRPFELGIVGDPVNYEEEMQGMPEFENEKLNPFMSIKVSFLTEEDVKKFAAVIGQNITDKTKSIWYPKHIFDQMGTKAGLIYTDESTVSDIHNI